MSTRPTPPKRADAIAAIRALAARREISIARNAQRGMNRLGYDALDVTEVLSECALDECTGDEPDDFRQNNHMYVFCIELEEELPLYVKVSLNIATLGTAELASFKLDGSPE